MSFIEFVELYEDNRFQNGVFKASPRADMELEADMEFLRKI